MTAMRRMAAGMMVLFSGAVAIPEGAVAATPAGPGTVPLPWSQARSRPVLHPGDTGVWVGRLNAALHLGASGETFTRRTSHAVRAFREAHALRRRSVVNARVWRLLGDSVPVAGTSEPLLLDDRPELRQGDSSDYVAALQRALRVSPASGYFGPLTLRSVKDLQSDSGLPVTGVVDAATWAALGDRFTPPAVDPTMTGDARSSRAARKAVGWRAFAASASARMVTQRESNGLCGIVSSNGLWQGKWQMDANFWQHYGGTAFAPSPSSASCEAQDRIAYRGWVDQWWWPWRTGGFPA